MPKPTNQLKREYLQKTASGTAQTTMGTLENKVYQATIPQGGSLRQKQQVWVRAKIAALGGTPRGSQFTDHVKQLLALMSKPVSKVHSQNMRTLWQNL